MIDVILGAIVKKLFSAIFVLHGILSDCKYANKTINLVEIKIKRLVNLS